MIYGLDFEMEPREMFHPSLVHKQPLAVGCWLSATFSRMMMMMAMMLSVYEDVSPSLSFFFFNLQWDER